MSNQAVSALSPFWAITNFIVRKISSRNAVKFPVPVISVGNIVAGGVGKTEVATAIAAYLNSKGKKVVVASRGYGSPWSARGGVARDIETARSLKFPDESMVVLKKAKGVSVSVGADRVQVLQRYWEELQPDVIILDDGFQHFKIKRDLDILVHDFSVRWPLLRDMPIYFNKVGVRIALSPVPEMWKRIDWVSGRYRITSKLPSEALIFCGIGNPSRFKNAVKSSGMKVIAHKFFKDHHDYTEADIRKIMSWRESRSPNAPLMTTLKDHVKLMPYLQSQGGIMGFEPQVVDIELDLFENANLLWQAVDRLVLPG